MASQSITLFTNLFDEITFEDGNSNNVVFQCGCIAMICILKTNMVVFTDIHATFEEKFLQCLCDETFVKYIFKKFSKSIIEVVVSNNEKRHFLDSSKYWVSSNNSRRFFAGALSVACFNLPSCYFTTLDANAPYEDPCEKYITFFNEYRVIGPNVLGTTHCDWFKRTRVKSRFYTFQDSAAPLDKVNQYTLDIVENQSGVPILVFGKLFHLPFDENVNQYGFFNENFRITLRQCAHAHALKMSDHELSQRDVSFITEMHFSHQITMF